MQCSLIELAAVTACPTERSFERHVSRVGRWRPTERAAFLFRLVRAAKARENQEQGSSLTTTLDARTHHPDLRSYET